MASGVAIVMREERETKNTVRFYESHDEGDEPVIGTLYVPKVTLRELEKAGAPSKRPYEIEVTIRVLP